MTEPVSLLGCGSLGANVATWAAIKFPQRVQSLLLVSPEPPQTLASVARSMRDEWLPLALSNKPGKGGDDTGAIPLEALLIMKTHYVQNYDRDPTLGDGLVADFMQRFGVRSDGEDIKRQVALYDEKMIPLHERASITCPVLVLRGSNDVDVCPESAADEWANSFTAAKGGAKVHSVIGAHFYVLVFDSNISTRIITQFCRRALGRSA